MLYKYIIYGSSSIISCWYYKLSELHHTSRLLEFFSSHNNRFIAHLKNTDTIFLLPPCKENIYPLPDPHLIMSPLQSPNFSITSTCTYFIKHLSKQGQKGDKWTSVVCCPTHILFIPDINMLNFCPIIIHVAWASRTSTLEIGVVSLRASANSAYAIHSCSDLLRDRHAAQCESMRPKVFQQSKIILSSRRATGRDHCFLRIC